MNAYTVTVWNTDTQTTRTMIMHGMTENEIMGRANATISDADQVTDVSRNV